MDRQFDMHSEEKPEMQLRSFLNLSMLCMAALFCCGALGAETAATRYGNLEAVRIGGEAGQYAVNFRGAKLFAIKAEQLTLQVISSKVESDYVLADIVQADQNCKHQFKLIEIQSNGVSTISKQFGDCKELFGARFDKAALVLQLIDPYAASDHTSPFESLLMVHEFIWKSGQMDALPGAMKQCPAYELSSKNNWITVAPEKAFRPVTGSGRAYFHTAPVDNCKGNTLFLIPGDQVTIENEVDGFSMVRYRNPKSNKDFTGWIKSERLKP